MLTPTIFKQTKSIGQTLMNSFRKDGLGDNQVYRMTWMHTFLSVSGI